MAIRTYTPQYCSQESKQPEVAYLLGKTKLTLIADGNLLHTHTHTPTDRHPSLFIPTWPETCPKVDP